MMTHFGIVMDVKEDYSIFLTEDGEFMKGIPASDAEVGEYAHFTEYKAPFKLTKSPALTPILAIAATMVLIFGASFSDIPEAYAFVELENGERIELGIDKEGTVIYVEGVEEHSWEDKALSKVLVEIVKEKPQAKITYDKPRDGAVERQLTTAIEKAEEAIVTNEEPAEEIQPVTSEPVETDEEQATKPEDEDKPGNSEKAPGQTGETPGQSGIAPGKSGQTPANGAQPPGKSGEAPGKSGKTPGKSGDNPGQSKDKNGNSKDKPGNSQDKSHKNKDESERSTDKPGKSESAPGQQNKNDDK
ncbi:hypothetical protein CQS04_06895 [Chryseomicrobium excrementi]|uniref:RsgI N-terminal anti-sigma domain-containing protein n=1 Tax=Chryseomicrobium excrementi TaxID=2041346 RepID=A0A2M9F091_9BACL|nr:hypothetical protein [Chryseomicrobium excrementi]PJK16874.1 hypothetical protein CQS04_06895 [Chryseomicrobium excrementi]